MSKRPKILLVDDEAQIRRPIELHLNRCGYRVHSCTNGEAALERLDAEKFDLVITDIKMPKMSGSELLQQIRIGGSDLPVIVLTAFATVESAVEAMKLGADDYICKPPQLGEIEIKVRQAIERRSLAAENKRLKTELDRRFGFGGIIGESAVMRELHEKIAPLARDRDISVLLTGESGTGKELVAQAIHQNGPRSGKPFIAVNCAALPDNLIESELFGHEKGAFTDASVRKQGLFEAADGGTLFLDEISSMPLPVQAKLLRAIEEREVRKVGGTDSSKVDIRLICASNADLPDLVESGSFRSDLFYRIAVATVDLPPLRDREGDVKRLALHFLEAQNAAKGRQVELAPETLRAFEEHSWPGNVRELENLVELIVVTAGEDPVGPDDLPKSVFALDSNSEAAVHSNSDLKEARGMLVADFEKAFIKDHLQKNRWNISKTADEIGISRPALHSKIKEYGLSGPESENA